MDDVESSEFIEEDLEEYSRRATVRVLIRFKSGFCKAVQFEVPQSSPVYAEPITSTTIYDIIATGYSLGEAPILALPDGEGQTFLDLNAVDFVNVEVTDLE